MRRLTALVMPALIILALTACASFSTSSGTSSTVRSTSPRQAPVPSGHPPQQAPSDAVTGTITWPAGKPVANTQVFWYLGGYSRDSAGVMESQISATGRYSLSDCPCSPLVGYLHVPPPSEAWPLNERRDCWIILQTHGTYSGITARPGTVINWQAMDMPCASSTYGSGPSDVQPEIHLLNSEIANPAGGQTATGGRWQDVENRTSGRLHNIDNHSNAECAATMCSAIKNRQQLTPLYAHNWLI
jgi:hypothetical protein